MFFRYYIITSDIFLLFSYNVTWRVLLSAKIAILLPLHRVFVDVTPNLLKILFISNNMIIERFLPYGQTGPFCHHTFIMLNNA